MNHNTFKTNAGPDEYGIDDDELEYRTPFERAEGGGWFASAKQRQDRRECPHCHRSDAVVVHDHYFQHLRMTMPDGTQGVLSVLKTKFLCRRCGKCFTVPLKGVAKGDSLSATEKEAMKAEFSQMKTFAAIAEDHNISVAHAMRLFDRAYPSVPRLPLPKALCIDEILFCDRIEGRYPAVLYDFDTREVVDMVASRQKPYLEEYFSKIPDAELKNVRYFISDMYDAYHRIGRKFFPNATHVVDLFHVVEQLTRAVSRLRASLMNSVPKDGFEYGFMKSRWKAFQVRKCEISRSYYTHRASGASMRSFDALMLCLNLSPTLWDAWSILQELYDWDLYDSFTEALAFVERISKRLTSSPSELLKGVGRTYWKWRVEIANGLIRREGGKHFHNGVAESLNKEIKRLKTLSNGCVIFPRFRKRVLLILNKKKGKK